MDRVVVFIDYQNAYRGARGTFYRHEVDPHWRGQFSPLALGELLAARGLDERELVQVRVYRGLPSSNLDPKGYAAARSQISVWQRDPLVKVITRPLRYPRGWPRNHSDGTKPGEKGIDVQLAIDFATMAVRGEYDYGILVSRDTDLKPPLEFVMSNDVAAHCEVASWRGSEPYTQRLAIAKGLPYCHWISAQDFAHIEDTTDYSRR